MSVATTHFFTVGHSTHTVEVFVGLLQAQGVTAVADVRSSPYSRFAPQFNREVLDRHLRSIGVAYVFLGRELGARSQDPACYENGRVLYGRLARTPLFEEGLTRLVRGSRTHQIAIMCAEKEPLECHRALLIARALVERGFAVDHILGDGRVEAHREAMVRLLALLGLPTADMFRSFDDLVREGLALQEERIAFVNNAMAVGTHRRSA